MEPSRALHSLMMRTNHRRSAELSLKNSHQGRGDAREHRALSFIIMILMSHHY